MKGPLRILALGLAVLTGPACGRKGPLQPPLSRGPQAASGLTAVQRGGSALLEWTNPVKSVDGRPLGPLAAAEVWTLDLGSGEAKAAPNLRDFKARAGLGRRISAGEMKTASRTPPGRPATVKISYPLAGGKAGAFAFSVRVMDAKRRLSEFCPPVLFLGRVCPLPPETFGVRVFEDRVELSWAPPPSNTDGSRPARVSGYAVYRSERGGEAEKLTLSPVAGTLFEDRSFRFGEAYAYTVRACAAGTEPALESDDSAPRTVVPRDVFPPGPPSGLVAIAGPGAIALSWRPGPEADLAGYKVWRKEEGGSGFALLTPAPLAANAYTDVSAEKGKSYVYAVSALDRDGNEGPKTELGPVSLKGNGA